jgi:hypothetical protein
MDKNYEIIKERFTDICAALEKGYKIEVVPTKEGCKLLTCERHELKLDKPVSKR